MTQDISQATIAATDKEKASPAKKYWIIEIFKKLLEFNGMKSGIKKKF